MRWYIIRTLLWKEVQRQRVNRGGLALACLLIVAALLLNFFSKNGAQASSLSGGLNACYIDCWREDAWVQHLRDHAPADLAGKVVFRNISQLGGEGRLVYPPDCGAIQMRLIQGENGRVQRRICMWTPAGESLAVFEAWFWRESARFFQQQAAEANKLSLRPLLTSDPNYFFDIEREHSILEGGANLRTSITAGLILFALFFSCVYLMPSLMCEEQERGLLLAQALSPASPLEILAARFLFYPPIGIALGALLAGIAKPAVLLQLFFWGVLTVTACGSLGIGLVIATLARTQRSASMAALCYMLVVTLLLFICQQGAIPVLPNLALEYHCPRMLHACLSGMVARPHLFHLGAAAALAGVWLVLACALFRKRGWQ
jgi:hypothetical protein